MSYNTIQFVKSNPLQGMTALEKAIALPHEYPAQRFPSFPALERTATMAFNLPVTLGFPSGATEMKGLLCRQPAWPLWVQQTQSTLAQMAVYQSTGPSGVAEAIMTNNSRTSFSIYERPVDFYNTSSTASIRHPGMLGITSPNWTYPLLGGMDTRVYTYVPANTYLSLVVGMRTHTVNTGAALNVSVIYEYWHSPTDVYQVNTPDFTVDQNFLAGTYTVGIATANAWIRPLEVRVTSGITTDISEVGVTVLWSTGLPTFTQSAITFGSFTFSDRAATLFVPVGPVPEFDVTERPWQDTRTTASAVLLTNVTKVLNKEGTVLAGRLPNTTEDMWNFTNGSLSQLHPAEKAMLALETGFYTYAPPSTDMASFWDHALFRSGPGAYALESAPLFRLDNTSYGNCFILTDSDATTPSTFAVNLDWHIEFRNNSTLFPIGMSSITLEAFHQAILQLVSHGFFFSNDKHKGLIGKIVAASKLANKYAVPLLPGPYQTVLRGGMKLADKMISRRPNTTPATTSASGSGMIPKAPPKQNSKTTPARKTAKQNRRK